MFGWQQEKPEMMKKIFCADLAANRLIKYPKKSGPPTIFSRGIIPFRFWPSSCCGLDSWESTSSSQIANLVPSSQTLLSSQSIDGSIRTVTPTHDGHIIPNLALLADVDALPNAGILTKQHRHNDLFKPMSVTDPMRGPMLAQDQDFRI